MKNGLDKYFINNIVNNIFAKHIRIIVVNTIKMASYECWPKNHEYN